MATLTTFRMLDPFGVFLTEIADYTTADYVLNCAPGGVGVLELTVPLSFNPAFLLEDARLLPMRSINGRAPYHDNGAVYLLRYVDKGPETTLMRGYHASHLLSRRSILYAAGSTYTSKAAAAADDQIKAFVNENMLAGIVGADRDGVETYADVSAYLTKQANLAQGASVAMSAARRLLLDVASDLANASATAGTYLTFEIIAPSEGTLELRTYATQRGVDRRAGTANPIILSALRGSLTNAHVITDYTAAKTFVSAGGQGEQTTRLIGTAFDATSAGNSPFGRNELFRDSPNVSTQAAVDDEADSQLYASRPVVVISGNLIETPALTRGIEYDLGDIVTAEAHDGTQYDVRVDMIHEHIDASGNAPGQSLTAHQTRAHKSLIGLRTLT